MHIPSERFCGLMAEVTCEVCPIRAIDEQTWEAGLHPGVTPFEAATHVATEVNAIHEETLEPEYDYEDDDYVEYDPTVDAPTQTELRGDNVVHALHPTILPTSDAISQAVEGAQAVTDEVRPTVTIVHALGGCVEKQLEGDCAIGHLFDQMIEALPGLVDKGMGAAVLDSVARFGSHEEALQMAARIQDVIEDIFLRSESSRAPRLIDFAEMPDAVARGYLMKVAEILESGGFGSV